MPPVTPGIPQINTKRPECVALANRIKELRALQKEYRDQLKNTHDLEERQEILDILAGLEEHINALLEELAFQGCYVVPTPRGLFLKVVGLEATQSTQFFTLEGTGAGADNSIRLIANKPTLARVYLRSELQDAVTVTGRLTVAEFNKNTLKYDLVRATLSPAQTVSLPALSASRRRQYNESLNFLLPTSLSTGSQVRFHVLAWVDGHEGDPVYEGEGAVAPLDFVPRRVPILHLFRVNVTRRQTVAMPGGPPVPVVSTLAAPSLANCLTTMDLAERMFPVSDLDIRDRGTITFPATGNAPLEVVADYEAVRLAIQAIRDGTTPTPQDHEIYVGMIASHPNMASLFWGNAAAGAIESVDGFSGMFAHELGHLMLPGDDHVNDANCTNNNLLTQIDPNYPDYKNTAQAAGIGEFGVDLGTSPPTPYGPDTADIMSYCTTRWISPYNYNRAMTGPVLTPPTPSPGAAPAGGAQKLLLAFRVYRDGRVELKHGMHLPGEPRPFPAKTTTGLFVELYDTDNRLLASAECCQRSPHQPKAAPFEDFQEVLPWNEQTAYVLVVREGREVARWEVEEPSDEPPVADLAVREGAREGGGAIYNVTWQERGRAKARHTLVRWTPDDGRTWYPVATGCEGGRAEVNADCLTGRETGRFQLAVSTGFRTHLVESGPVPVPRRARRVEIHQPANGAEVAHGRPLRLSASAADGTEEGPAVAYWTSNRDGFLGDGFRVLADRLSPGRHVLTFTAVDGSGGELKESVIVRVQQNGGNPGHS